MWEEHYHTYSAVKKKKKLNKDICLFTCCLNESTAPLVETA